MDYTTIIVAALSLIGTLIGSFLANSKGAALIAYRLEELEKKVQKHNWIIPKKVDKKSKSRFSLDRRKPMIMKVRSDRIIKSIDIFKNSEFQIIERGIRSSISFL